MGHRPVVEVRFGSFISLAGWKFWKSEMIAEYDST